MESAIDKSCFPADGCLVCIRNCPSASRFYSTDTEQTYKFRHNTQPSDLSQGSMICIQLPNGFEFSLYGQALININKTIIELSNNCKNVSLIHDFLVSLINDMYKICRNMRNRCPNNESTPCIPAKFEQKYIFKESQIAENFGLFNQTWHSVYKANSATYRWELTALNKIRKMLKIDKTKSLQRTNLMVLRNACKKRDNNRWNYHTFDEWIDLLTEYQNEANISDSDIQSCKKWIDIINYSKNNYVAMHKYGNTSCRYEWEIISNKDGIYETYVNHIGGVYYNIESCKVENDRFLCWSHYESKAISKIIQNNVDCMKGLSVICDIIALFCAGKSNNIGKLFEEYRMQLENIENDIQYFEDEKKYKYDMQVLQMSW